MKRYVFLIVLAFFLTTNYSHSQLYLGGGANSVLAFGIKSPYTGLHLFGEYLDVDQSYYGKFSSTLYKSESDVLISLTPLDPNALELGSTTGKIKFNYSNFEFGKRRYFGDDLEFGLSGFGGTHANVGINQLRLQADSYDTQTYTLGSLDNTKGSILSLAFGLNGGIQNAFYFGTFYVDAGLNYVLTALPSNDFAASTTSFKSLFFVFNVGFKKRIGYNY